MKTANLKINGKNYQKSLAFLNDIFDENFLIYAPMKLRPHIVPKILKGKQIEFNGKYCGREFRVIILCRERENTAKLEQCVKIGHLTGFIFSIQ